MSSTNRGSNRAGHDFYQTPCEVLDNLFNHINLDDYGDNVLEPGAGQGNICTSIRNRYLKCITAIEIQSDFQQSLELCSDRVIIGDFLSMSIPEKFDIIIGNPPYNQAMEFVDKSLSLLSNNGVLILLLRTAFLESKARYDFWQRNPLSSLFVLSKRPSFTGKGTDSCSYSWFIWDKSVQNQKIKVI